MSAAKVTVRYDGPALASHRMDIADIAPALLGISDLCRIANRRFNGDRAAVKVLIGTDTEHQCFQLDLHIVQSCWDAVKGVLSHDDVKSAKEILEWIGLIGGSAAGGYGLFQLLKYLRGRPITSTSISHVDGRDLVQVVVNGDSNNVLLVRPEAFDLLRTEGIVANAKKVVQPVTQEGYEKVEFEVNDQIAERIEKQEALSIASLKADEMLPAESEVPQRITAWISVYSPVYDSKSIAPKWRFKFGDAHEYMDISETTIAEDAMRRGGSMADDAYRVELEITQIRRTTGSITTLYKILRVLDFKPATLPYQSDAFRAG
jgi:hypothetical protein